MIFKIIFKTFAVFLDSYIFGHMFSGVTSAQVPFSRAPDVQVQVGPKTTSGLDDGAIILDPAKKRRITRPALKESNAESRFNDNLLC